MCHSSDSVAGRTHPEPRNPSNVVASAEPARIHASISSLWPGAIVRVMETVTGAGMRPILRAARSGCNSGWQSVAMPESAAEIYARAVEAAGADGRLPTPPIGGWDVFPWESFDGAVVPKVLAAPTEPAPRAGEQGGAPCGICTDLDPATVVWEDEFWVLTHRGAPSGLPLALTLWTREHLDVGDLDDEIAS